jgi:hypothetical protein
MGELPIERDQSVGLDLGQSDVLGVKHVRPPELAGDLPRDVLKGTVSEQPDPEPAHVAEVSPGVLLSHLAAMNCLVEKRQHVRAKKRRSQDLMFTANHGIVVSQVNGDVRTDHVPGHGRPVPLRCCAAQASTSEYGDAAPAHRQKRKIK